VKFQKQIILIDKT